MTVQGFGEADFEARPGNAAGTMYPGEPETRKNNDIMPGNGWTRRRFALAGGATLALVGSGATYLLWPEGGVETDTSPGALQSPEQTKPRGDFDQVPRVFYGPDGEPLELRREQIAMPETLDPPTFEEAFANVAQAIQFYVNNGDVAGIQSVVPGTTNIDAMSPGQLYMRAAFIKNWREVYGINSDQFYAAAPENIARHYSWGLRVQLLEQTTERGAKVADTEMVSGKVRVAIGDYRPEINGHHRVWQIEKPRTYEGNMTITRYANIGLNARLPGNGWGVYQMSFPGIPPLIAERRPKGYEQIPLLYPGLGR